jgi:UDP-glucose 4-epimerase
MKKVFVTGGAGFIGSHLVEALERRGDQVCVIDNLSSGFRDNLAKTDAQFIVSDIRDEHAVFREMEGTEVMFHLAAFVSVPASVSNPVECYDTNVMGSLNLLKAAQELGVKRIVMASSAAVYGERTEVVSETDQLSPVSPYATSKISMEDLARVFSKAYGLETVCLRFFNVYGPRQSPNSTYAAAIPRFTQDLINNNQVTIRGDGAQTRDFIFISDVVQGLLKASDVAGVSGEVFNLAGGKSISIMELVDILHRFFPEAKEPNYGPARDGDIRFSQADISKAREALGYRPEVDVEEGLRRTVEWFRAKS